MTDTIKVYFKWVSFQPDRRQWKPSNPLFEPFDIGIVIDVPLKHEYIYNVEQIIQKQLENAGEPRPYLTVKGMKYCIDQFEDVMSDQPEKQEETDDTEWEVIDSPTDDKEEWETITNNQTDEWK